MTMPAGVAALSAVWAATRGIQGAMSGGGEHLEAEAPAAWAAAACGAYSINHDSDRPQMRMATGGMAHLHEDAGPIAGMRSWLGQENRCAGGSRQDKEPGKPVRSRAV